ncbi:MAG TPA: hypothetical protein VGE16_05995 [Albitalea sp.]
MHKTDLFRSTGADTAGPATPGLLGLDAILQAQAQLWNQMLDANRTLWSFYAPWLQATPWLLNGAAVAAESEEKGLEPATTADGLPDAFELQARSWNRLLDAQRSFWTSVNWPMAQAPWMQPTAATGDATGPAPTERGASSAAAAKRPRAGGSKATRRPR